MILIADSGSTKTEWCVLERGEVKKRFFSDGINPYYEGSAEIVAKLTEIFDREIAGDTPSALYFYGAGCTEEKSVVVTDALKQLIGDDVMVEVKSDLLGAARSLYGNTEGIACIMGTGSNSCLYNGKEIVQNISPLGFIIGDEGSGASIGKIFIGKLLKNQYGKELMDKFLSETGLTPAEIVNSVYRKPFPNRFLASFSPFIRANIDDKEVYDTILDCFCDFFKHNILQYNCTDMPIAFIGSVAYYYSDILKEAARRYGLSVAKIEKTPMQGLVNYHKEFV